MATTSSNGESPIMIVAMQKGGVGKTTTAINLACGLAFADEQVLLVDLDPQANATSGMGVEVPERAPTMHELLFKEAPPDAALRETSVKGLSLLPSGQSLHGARARLNRADSDFMELARALDSLQHRFDRVIIDCPPSLGPLTLNAMMTGGSLLIPLQSEYYALEGLSQLWDTVQELRRRARSELDLGGILLTMFDGRTNLAEEVKQDVQTHFSDALFETLIPRNVRISEAPGHGEPVITYAPHSPGARAYLAVTEEVLERERTA